MIKKDDPPEVEAAIQRQLRFEKVFRAEVEFGCALARQALARVQARRSVEGYVGTDAEFAQAAAVAGLVGELEVLLDSAPAQVLHMVRSITLQRRIAGKSVPWLDSTPRGGDRDPTL